MQILETIIPFILIHFFIFLIPGPNISLVIRNTLKYGLDKGIFSTIGITCAITLHTIFALLATDILLTKFHTYFFYMQAMGAFYLISLGVSLLKNACKKPVLVAISTSCETRQHTEIIITNGQAFQMSFLLDLFNPYIALFYLSIFPVYLKDLGLSLALPILGGLVAILNFSWFGSVSYVVAWTQSYFSFSISDRWLELLTGVAMIGFGVYQMVSR